MTTIFLTNFKHAQKSSVPSTDEGGRFDARVSKQ